MNSSKTIHHPNEQSDGTRRRLSSGGQPSEAIEPTSAKATADRQAQQSNPPSQKLRRAAELDSLTPEPRSPCPELVEGLNPDRMRWYVVQSKPREELRAELFLKEKGIRTYLPRMEVASIRGFSTDIQEKPLFPGYLFCRFDLKESLHQVRWTKGVAKILPESANPVPVQDEVVAAIQSLEHKDGIIRKKPLKKRDQIRIARGPMKDILGIFEHWTADQGRVRVLLNFINYQAAVELHHSFIERVTVRHRASRLSSTISESRAW